MDTQEQRRLLDLAAKAAGLRVVSSHDAYGLGIDGLARWWAPHLDDGDSRRLQVALELELRVFNGQAHAGKQDQFWVTENWFPDGDPNTASRLAVLRAAAAIGEKMEAKP